MSEMTFRCLVLGLLCLIAMRVFAPPLSEKEIRENGHWVSGAFFVAVLVATAMLGRSLFG